MSSRAPLSAGWELFPDFALSPPQGASPLLGTAILQSQYGGLLRLVVEIGFGAIISNPEGGWPWTDVTRDVLQDEGKMISWTIGQQDEMSAAAPASCTFDLDNRQNLYSANNPLSPNWPNVVRNTPIRVRMSQDGGNTWFVKFQGYANGFTPAWDATGTRAFVTVSASGVFRRLNQGTTPLHSTLYRDILASGPVAYWPCEDAANSTQCASAISGGTPMTASNVTFAANTVVPGSGPQPTLGSTSTFYAPINGTFTGQWQVFWNFYMPAAPGVDTFIMQIATPGGAIATWQVQISAAGNSFWIFGYSASGTQVIAQLLSDSLLLGQWNNWYLTAQQSGGNINWGVWHVPLVTPQGAFYGGTSGTTAGTISYPVSALIPASSGLNGCAFGHLAARNTYDTLPFSHLSGNGYEFETPGARMTRLCSQYGMPFSIVGTYSTTESMGSQTVNTFISLLREAELADAGFLYDGLSSGLQYQGISQRLDQAVALTLDATSSAFMAPFEALDDDFRTRNSILVTRKNGSSASAEDDTGPLGVNNVGKYDTSITVNHADDSELYNRASWELHSGTLAGFRYPAIELDLAARPAIGKAWLNRADGGTGPVVPGSHIQVTNVSSWISQHPPGPVDLCVIGWTEQINQVQWKVRLNCMPNNVYNTLKIGDSSVGRLDTAGGTTLSADAASGATTLTVATTDDKLWTTTATFPSDFPMSVYIDGIQVTVTGISGTSSPQTFTVTGVTKTLKTGKAVKLWNPGVISL